jgi:hypothetical protein
MLFYMAHTEVMYGNAIHIPRKKNAVQSFDGTPTWHSRTEVLNNCYINFPFVKKEDEAMASPLSDAYNPILLRKKEYQAKPV